MRLFGSVISVSLFPLVLMACTTSEALTPRADIGQPGHRSMPVTQADTEQMARSAPPDAGIRSAALPPASGRSAARPQNGLEAQAEALDNGSPLSPASSGPPPQWQGQDGGQDRSPQPQRPDEGQAPPRGQPPQQAAAPADAGTPKPGASALPASPRQASLPPAADGAMTIRFLPIIGAPVEAVTPLSRRLGAEARAAGLSIRPSSDEAAQTILKGYFSAFAAEGKVTVVYVWDILDPAGARLHRMQGQDSIAGSGADPWSVVPAAMMEAIASKTMQDYMAWRRAQAG